LYSPPFNDRDHSRGDIDALSLGEISEWTIAVCAFGHPKMGKVFLVQNLPPFAAKFDRLAFFKIYPAMHRTAAPSCELLSSKMLDTESSHTHRKANTAEKEGERIVPQPDSSWGVHESPPGTSIFPGTPRRLHPCGQRKLAVIAGTRRRTNTSRLALRFAMALSHTTNARNA
jgi:hypothetical protein